MSDEPQNTYLSVRIPPALAADLKLAAAKECNTTSAVARRLIATGLARELKVARDDENRRG